MKNDIFILLCMVFCHIVDDYYLQGWLASAKQKEWWNTNAPEEMYKHDFLVALFMHSFSWTFMVMLVPNVLSIILDDVFYFWLFITNVVVHMFVDNLKANKKQINLVQDQEIHMLQIFITWYFMVLR